MMRTPDLSLPGTHPNFVPETPALEPDTYEVRCLLRAAVAFVPERCGNDGERYELRSGWV